MIPLMVAAALLFGNAVSVLAGNDRSLSNREILKQQDIQRALLYEQLAENQNE